MKNKRDDCIKKYLALYARVVPLLIIIAVIILFLNGCGSVIKPVTNLANPAMASWLIPYNSILGTIGGQLAIILLIETAINIMINKRLVENDDCSVTLPLSSWLVFVFGIIIAFGTHRTCFIRSSRANGYRCPSVVCFCLAILSTSIEQVMSWLVLGIVLMCISLYWSTQVDTAEWKQTLKHLSENIRITN